MTHNLTCFELLEKTPKQTKTNNTEMRQKRNKSSRWSAVYLTARNGNKVQEEAK